MDVMELPSVTETEFSEQFKIPKTTLRKWRHRRRGPSYFRLGGKIRYSLKDIELWIQASHVDPVAKRKQRNERKPQA